MGIFSLIGDAVGSIFGFAANKSADKSAQRINDQNVAAQQEANAQNIAFQRETNAQNYSMFQEGIGAQERALQQQIGWRMADARNSGIHPLAALGINPASVNPSFVGSVSPSVSPALRDNSHRSSTMADLGQNIGRAITSVATLKERKRAEAIMQTSVMLDLKRKGLENELLLSEIARNKSQIGPPNPTMGSVPDLPVPRDTTNRRTTEVRPRPAEPVMHSPGRPAQQAGAVADFGFARTDRGGLAVVPSKDVKELTEDDLVQQAQWSWRNNLLPAIRGMSPPNPRHYPLPPGATEWRWSAVNQTFFPYDRRTGEFFMSGRRVKALSRR